MVLRVASDPTGGEPVASGHTGGEPSYWWGATRTGGELLVLMASYSYWWRATRTGGEPVASGSIGGEWSY